LLVVRKGLSYVIREFRQLGGKFAGSWLPGNYLQMTCNRAYVPNAGGELPHEASRFGGNRPRDHREGTLQVASSLKLRPRIGVCYDLSEHGELARLPNYSLITIGPKEPGAKLQQLWK
jgi:hypothetical protein